MTDTARQAIVDKITARNSNPFCAELRYDAERREAYVIVIDLDDEEAPVDGIAPAHIYLSDMDPDAFDASDWNALVEWENANTLLAIYDEEGPAAATLWKLANG